MHWIAMICTIPYLSWNDKKSITLLGNIKDMHRFNSPAAEHAGPTLTSTNWVSRKREPGAQAGQGALWAYQEARIQRGAKWRRCWWRSFWGWNNPPGAKGLFWEAVEGAASKSWRCLCWLRVNKMGTLFFILWIVVAFVFEQRSDKMKVAFLERSTRCQQKECSGKAPNWEQEAIRRFLAV